METPDIERLARRIAQIKKEIAALGPLRPGSLSHQYNVCGNPTCRCKDPKAPRKHGPYPQLAYFYRGRHTTEFIRQDDLKNVKEQIRNAQRLRELVAEWLENSTAIARLRRGTTKAVRGGRREGNASRGGKGVQG
jgi:hypothetical protein